MGDGSASLEQQREEMDSPPVPDELLWDIFIRISDPADLARTSASCVCFRRLITDRSFLRQYRKIHPPPLLGFLDRGHLFHPATAPHPSASAASAVGLAADFSFCFLPAPARDWIIQDIRDGRVLLGRDPWRTHIHLVFPELVVCDPLHRRYLLIPPIPAHLAALVEDPCEMELHRHYETFLVPAGGGEEEASSAEETSFSVIWMAQCRNNKLVAFICTSKTLQWRELSNSPVDMFDAELSSSWWATFSFRQYAFASFYWMTDCLNKLLVLDTRRMEFSVADPPPEANGLRCGNIAIVEAGEGRLGMFVLGEDSSSLNFTTRRNNVWQFEKTILLDFKCSIMGSAGRHLFLYRLESLSHDASCFSLDGKTLELERVFISRFDKPYGHAYKNFPPSLLSIPTISSGIENGVEEILQTQTHSHVGHQISADVGVLDVTQHFFLDLDRHMGI